MKTILVPTDFSSNANNALKYANAFAQAMHCKLNLLNVYTSSLGRYNRISRIIAEETAMAKEHSKKAVG